MTTIRVIDVETTGTDPEDQVCEIAAVDIEDDGRANRIVHTLVKPTIPIKVVARAIHHISDEDVKNAPPWEQVRPVYLDNVDNRVGVTHFAAHNASFEERFIGPYLVERPLICTWKAALRVWPEAPGHSNMVLRYWRNLLPGAKGDHHRAAFDAEITAYILIELLKHCTLEEMIQWSKEPPLYPTCPIGDWRGKPWAEVELSFLEWILKKQGMEEDIKFNARRELERRAGPAKAQARAIYVEAAKKAAAMAISAEALEKWWKDEATHRAEHSIRKGDVEYEELVSACAARKAVILKDQAKSAFKGADSPTKEDVSGYSNILAAG